MSAESQQRIAFITALMTVIFVSTIFIGVLTSTFKIDIIGEPIQNPSIFFVILLAIFTLFMAFAMAVTWRRRTEIITKERSEGIFNIEDLAENPERFFRDEVWQNLPREPKEDIHEALIALNNGASTASILMGMKATEYALVEWFQIDTGRHEDAVSWIEINRWLERDPRFSDEDEGIVHRVNRIRKQRNMAAHTGASITEEDAEEFLLDVREVISTVYSRIDSYQTRLNEYVD